MDDETAGHPWTLTYGEFIDAVCSNYGFQLHETLGSDSRGQRVKVPYLRSCDGMVIPLPRHMDAAMRLNQYKTANLCRRLGVPPEDFGLLPEES
jgi:hypothetical protein